MRILEACGSDPLAYTLWPIVATVVSLVVVASAVVWTATYIPYFHEGTAVKNGMAYYPATEHDRLLLIKAYRNDEPDMTPTEFVEFVSDQLGINHNEAKRLIAKGQ